jgi:hypothetical protein
VDVCESDVIVQEHFFAFQETEETTGLLFVVIKKLLEDSKLDFKNCRRQGYDNGSNMRGRKQMSSSAYTSGKCTSIFMPCGCHSLNLVAEILQFPAKKLFRFSVLYSASTFYFLHL